ncbi:sensor histidine kinase [Alicycliphilus denitrificans]|uniref:sensor histidine kinase n=1 Tax=Alicycliphilus denitrificans TaxID=179636 RepID=UPI003A7FBC57
MTAEGGAMHGGTAQDRLQAELDEARRQMAAMAAAHEAFLRGVSHDLRAPLRHVTSYGALVRELLQELPAQYPQVEEALGFLATMDASARRMGLMIDGLQAIARAGRAPLRLQAVDLGAAVQQARALLGGAGDGVQWDVAPDMPAVRADADLFGQLLAQLLGNALKFTRGVAQARIAVHAEPDGQGRVRITVQDNGAGFDGTRAQQLFGVFQRMHREADFEGVGAGLALCAAIAQRHGATIAAAAAPGAGCSIRLDWPGAA